MDLFYKPPLQRPDECEALEENYINCLMQKALRDNVQTNRCSLDSVLWFHLECPKASAKFDDPIEFKRKFRDFFAATRQAKAMVSSHSDEQLRIKEEYGVIHYPEDIKEHTEYRQFKEIFDQYSPVRKPEPEEEYEDEDLNEFDEYDKKNVMYGTKPEWFIPKPITREDSLKHPPTAQ